MAENDKKKQPLPLLSPLQTAALARRRRLWLLIFLLATTLPSLAFWWLAGR